MLDMGAVARAVGPAVGVAAKRIETLARENAVMKELKSGPHAYKAEPLNGAVWRVGSGYWFAHIDEWAGENVPNKPIVPSYALSRAAAQVGDFTPE